MKRKRKEIFKGLSILVKEPILMRGVVSMGWRGLSLNDFKHLLNLQLHLFSHVLLGDYLLLLFHTQQ